MAEVWVATDVDLDRKVAVKWLRSTLATDPVVTERFRREAIAVARLSHPNTVPIHFVGEGEGLVYYAMPYLEGRTVAELLRSEGALSPDFALRIVEPILDAWRRDTTSSPPVYPRGSWGPPEADLLIDRDDREWRC